MAGKLTKKIGLPPGALVHVGARRMESTKITIFDYDENGFREKEVKEIAECIPYRDAPTVTWIDVDGVHDVDVVAKLGECFGVHSLLMEDILNTNQRPKTEEAEKYVYVVLRMIYFEKDSDKLASEQVSIVFGENFVISFQEAGGDVFDAIRDRIRTGKGKLRGAGADYLAYALMDAIVDNYFIVIERLGERVDELEEETLKRPGQKVMQKIHSLRREMLFLRRSVWPLREAVSALQHSASPLIKAATRPYFKDVYDHTIQVMDAIETFREMVSGMFEMYLSSVSNRLNEVMKVLTIISTIFIPLTCISGYFGMNVIIPGGATADGWRWSWLVILAVMLCIAAGMLVYFKRKKWL